MGGWIKTGLVWRDAGGIFSLGGDRQIPGSCAGSGGQSRDLMIPGEQVRGHIRLPSLCLSALLLILLSCTACGTLEVGIVPTSPSDDAATATMAARSTESAGLMTPEAGTTPEAQRGSSQRG